MATMWRKAMIYLGLGPDEEYDDYDPGYDDPVPEPAPPARARVPANAGAGSYAPSAPAEEPSAIGTVRPFRSEPRSEPVPAVAGPMAGAGQAPPRPRSPVVRPIPAAANAKPHVVVPTSFNQAQEVADKFKGSQPVIVNLQAADRDLARRVIDFASGLCYGLGGQMEKVAHQVYLLTPSNVEVSAEERRRLHERGYDA
ncbi:MAG: cell division protein SepF [Actinobacteria bacterium]|nr:cell division protein SepF [Actinomycetota bacterium]